MRLFENTIFSGKKIVVKSRFGVNVVLDHGDGLDDLVDVSGFDRCGVV